MAYLTEEERKRATFNSELGIHFHSCNDLSCGVYCESGRQTVKLSDYSNALAAFITNWTYFTLPKLNGFSGFSHIKFTSNFTVIPDYPLTAARQ